MIELSPTLQPLLPPDGVFDFILRLEGKVHREIHNRRTVEFTLGQARYFVKIQRGCGWGEIFKNLFAFRAPIVSARNEWLAIGAIRAARIRTLTVVGRGLRGSSPAAFESFVITEALEGMVSLEQLAVTLGELDVPKRTALKRALLRAVADISRKLHGAGLNHRDFYLCHFLVKDRDWKQWHEADALELFLIDLHRVQRRIAVPRRWLVKDLGGLLFSALDAGLTRRDLLRFIEIYTGRPWREALANDAGLWNSAGRNAVALYRRFHHREPPLKLPSP